MSKDIEFFDSHLHIIDPRFPLVENNGYLPEAFTYEAYLNRVSNYTVLGGAVVSGSFQGFDQSYLLSALKSLGPNFFGVTQLPQDVTDQQIIGLNDAGVRAVRFNLYRGGSEDIKHLFSMATRVYELARWHIELYVDSSSLESLASLLEQLPAVSIDHLGLKKAGLPYMHKLAERGVKIKATGFGRLDFDASEAIASLYKANPGCLMFGTDLPSTRALTPFQHSHIDSILDVLDAEGVANVFRKNAMEFYSGTAR